MKTKTRRLWPAVIAFILALAIPAYAQITGPGTAGAYIGSRTDSAPPITFASAATLSTVQSGKTLINAGSSGTVTLSIPDGLPIGTEYILYETDAHNFGVMMTGSEVIRVSTSGTQSTCGAIAQGSTFRIKKLTATTWGLMYFVGSVG